MIRSILAAAALCAGANLAPAQTFESAATAPGAVAQEGAAAQAIERTLARISLPAGFRISLYALAPGARHIAIAPSGAFAIVGSWDRTMHVVDLADPAKARSVRVFAPDIAKRIPNGACFAPDGTMYLPELNRVLAFPRLEAGLAAGRVEAHAIVAQGALIPASEEANVHGARVCRVGPDDRLYVALGQPYNVPPKSKRALYAQWGIGGIVSMTRAGADRQVYASGIRNSVGVAFNPADGTLWHTDNQVDGMGDDIPPGELNRSTAPGQNFGFPWYGGGAVRTREYADETPPANLVFPQIEMAAHAADLGLAFYTGAMFPARYRGAIFSAQHGSWDRTKPIGARLMVTFLKPDGTAERADIFAQGWIDANGRYLGRPVDVAVAPDGSLLVSDDRAGALYRISYEGR